MLRRILLAVDGSDQSLDAIRYVSSMVPAENTRIVLFHVGAEYPEVFWDMDRNPLYRSKKPKVMGWLADRKGGLPMLAGTLEAQGIIITKTRGQWMALSYRLKHALHFQ